MSFKDIKGQNSVLDFLKGSIARDKVAHAYIFLGPSGVGKRLAAMNFAKALNCRSDESTIDACDQCPSCKKIDKRNHPDCLSLSPEKKGSSIKIDSIRELIKDVGLKPYEGKRKVYIIDEAASLTVEAANAILKTLEEPPRDVVIILIADTLGTIFDTIQSRSQIVRFSPLGAQFVKDILVKDYSLDGVNAHILANLFFGRLGEALKYNEKDFFSMRLNIVEKVLGKRCFDMDFDKSPREDVRMSLDIILSLYRDILAMKSGVNDKDLINIDKIDGISRESKALSFDYLDSVIEAIARTNQALDSNANSKIAMNLLGADICTR